MDHNSFYCQPDGGADLKNHKFKGQFDIFKTKTDLEEGVKAGIYIKENVEQLISHQGGSEEQKKVIQKYKSIMSRWTSLGLDIENNQYMGQQMFCLIEHYMEFEGEQIYLLFDYVTKIAVRAAPLKEIIESDQDPYISWATNEDPNIFWSTAPADPVRPVAEYIDITINQSAENREKKNFGIPRFIFTLVYSSRSISSIFFVNTFLFHC